MGVSFRHSALFAAITHDLTSNFYFVFYSERLDSMWILSSEEFLQECVTNKTGKNAGKRSIWFNGRRTDKKTGEKSEYCFERLDQYRCPTKFQGIGYSHITAEKKVDKTDIWTWSNKDSVPELLGVRNAMSEEVAAAQAEAANRLTLLSAGVQESHIAISNVCTMCNADTFYSYRAHRMENEQVAMIVYCFQE